MAVSNVPALLRHAFHGHQGYLTPRPSGELLVGATVEHVGFERAREVADPVADVDGARAPVARRANARSLVVPHHRVVDERHGPAGRIEVDNGRTATRHNNTSERFFMRSPRLHAGE